MRSLAFVVLLAGCDLATGVVERPAPQCTRDEDCVLLPAALTCCVECPPAPPFEPAPRWVLDGMLIEQETRCATPRSSCPEVSCAAPRPGCEARPACIQERCSFIETGCALPTS